MTTEAFLKQFSNDTFPSESLKAKTLSRMEELCCRPTRHQIRRPALAAVMIMIVLGMTAACATGLLSVTVQNHLSGELGESDAQRELIVKMGVPLDEKIISGEVAVTAKALLDDGHVTAVLFTVARVDGKPLVEGDKPDFQGLVFGCRESMNINFEPVWRKNLPVQFITYTPGEREGCFLYCFAPKDRKDNYCTVNFSDLEAWYEDRTENLTEGSCSWQFELPIPGTKECRTYAEDVCFEKNGERFRVEAMYVSPLSVRVDYTVLSAEPTSSGSGSDRTPACESSIFEMNDRLTAFTDGIDLILCLKNGDRIDMSTIVDKNGIVNPLGYVEYSVEQTSDITVHLGGVLPELIPYEYMKCVIFNGVEYFID